MDNGQWTMDNGQLTMDNDDEVYLIFSNCDDSIWDEELARV